MTLMELKSQAITTFVRNAWLILISQVVLAIVAALVLGWAAVAVRPLFSEREQLRAEVSEIASKFDRLKDSSARLATELRSARSATPIFAEAVKSATIGADQEALTKYDRAIELSPGDAYVYVYKAASQHELKNSEGAISSIRKALEINPIIGSAYIDLARYQCGAGKADEAVETLRSAISQRTALVQPLLKSMLAGDLEFRRACKPVVGALESLAGGASDSPPRQFLVFFGSDVCALPKEANSVLSDAAATVRAMGEASVLIVGQADTSAQRAQTLAPCRATAVKNAVANLDLTAPYRFETHEFVPENEDRAYLGVGFRLTLP